ncbi:MAG TPA: hypothetical protein VIK39_13420 [Candidatus Angelobacter sp.]
MATNAEIHVQIFCPHSHGLLRHIPVAFLAIDARADVWRMPESNVFRRIEPVHRLPGDVLFFGRITCQFLDLRIVGGNLLMTGHAEGDTGNSSVRTLCHPDVTTLALHAVLKMKPMIKRNRLQWCGLPLEVFFDGIKERCASRFENWGEICRRGNNGCFGNAKDS